MFYFFVILLLLACIFIGAIYIGFVQKVVCDIILLMGWFLMERYYLKSDLAMVSVTPITLIGVVYCVFEFFQDNSSNVESTINHVALSLFLFLFLASILHLYMARCRKHYLEIREHSIIKHLWYGKEYVWIYGDKVKYIYRNNRVKRIILYGENKKNKCTITDSFEICLDEVKRIITDKTSNKS